MLRKLLLTFVVNLLICSVLVMMAVVVDAYFMTMTAKERVKSISLSGPIFDLDSVRFVFPSGKPVVIVLFNSSCSSCVSELELLGNGVDELKQTEFVFLSTEPTSKLKSVAKQFGNHHNVFFAKLSESAMFENFGLVRYPMILIYDLQGKLNVVFNGEVTIEAISKHIPK